jgi:hypothetical protein
MTARAASRLAWGIAALSLLLCAGGVAVHAANSGVDGHRVFSLAIVVVFSAVGALIASRQPRNPIGWIFCGAAFAGGLSTLADAYANYWLDGKGGWKPLAEAAAAYETLGWIPSVLVPITFLLLLFPDGRLLTRRWRRVAWCAALGTIGFFVTQALIPGPLEDYPQLDNPYAIDSGVVELVQGLSALLLLVAVVGSPLSLFLRMRRASPTEREQIKWLVWAGAVAAVTFAIGAAGYDVWGKEISNAAILTSVLGLAVATGVAILKYRLYDIDVVINRTLVYGALTATLAGTYLASVLLLQLVLSPSSDLAVAGSTLAVAALFRPLRQRIQTLVDRRFYRRRYDAARTLESFGVRLRDEVDLDALGGELRGVVAETMQPAHVSLWLREPAR